MTTTFRDTADTAGNETMQAHEIAVKPPTVRTDDPVSKAVQLMVVNRLPGLIVVDDEDRPDRRPAGYPSAAARDSRLLPRRSSSGPDRRRSPRRPVLARSRASLTVGDCLPNPVAKPATVPPEATLLESPASWRTSDSPLIAVVDATGASSAP